jgi:metallo-beta-lactamase class B
LVVKTDAGLALFDGGLPQSAAEIAAHLTKLRLRLTDVKLIFNSHAHYDHAGGIAALQRASGATVVASARGAEALERGEPTTDDPQFGFGARETAFPKVPRVRRVADGEVVTLGDLAITTHQTPGHTPGSTSWSWRSCEGSRCLNVVYADSLSPVSADDFRFSGDGGARVEEFSRSIDKVAQLPCDILVVPHPSAVDLFGKLARRAPRGAAPDPLIDSAACRTYAASARERLKKRLDTEAQAVAQRVLEWERLTAPELARLDRAKTVVVLPGGVLEEHGPYLPAGSDAIFSQQLARDLAADVAAREGFTAVVLPRIPLGAGAANEIGGKYHFDGSATIRPETLRAVFMDLADQLGAQGYRYLLIVHGHGDPAHNRMLDDAGDYFRDTYGGSMLNVFGLVWAMQRDEFRSPDERAADGLAEHATMTETSVVQALAPDLVRPEVASAPPRTGKSMGELQEIAAASDWPGYFGAPALASPALGRKIYDDWHRRAAGVVRAMLAGEDLSGLPRYGTIYGDDPADRAAVAVNAANELRQRRWLERRMATER